MTEVAATDEVDVGCTLHDRRCGRCRSPSPAAACVIPCFQFSMHLHNLSSIFSLGKKASQRALRCTRVPHRTAATTRQPKASTTPAPDQKRAPDRTRPQANTAPAHPPVGTAPCSAAPGRRQNRRLPHRIHALAHRPCPPLRPRRTTPGRKYPSGCPPRRARPHRPERLETSSPHAFHRVFHIFAGFPQRLSFPLAFFERDRVRYALPYVPAVR